jgi:hypothetical protein
MALAACTTHTVALYAGEDGSSVLALPVEAWDERGTPYVADGAGLVDATTKAGFLKVEPAATAIPPQRQPRQPQTVSAGSRPRTKGPRERPGV